MLAQSDLMALAEPGASDEQLVAEVLAGEDAAFAELIVRYKSRVFRLAARYARQPSELDDICQEIFLQVYRKLRQFRGDAPFQHWLMRVATRKCFDCLRRRQRESHSVSIDAMLEAGHEPAEAAPPPAHPDLERLSAALAQLSPKERLVITLLELEDQTVAEVARLTGWSQGNVKIRAFRARAALRKLLELPIP